MKTSVALCTYNGEKFLREQLASIMIQTKPVDEIIVCDDGSTDSTLQIVEEYERNYPGIFKIHLNEINLRSVKNFEKAISLCENEIIFLCDQDDVWKPEKVNLFLDYFERNPIINVISSSAELIDESGVLIKKTTIWDVINLLNGRSISYDYFQIFSLVGNLATGANMAFRKDFVNSILPFPNRFFHHDEWISLASSSKNQFLFLSEKPSFYRIHEQQQVGSVFFSDDKNTESKLIERFDVYNKKDTFRLLKRRFSILKKNKKKILLIDNFEENVLLVKILAKINKYEVDLLEKLRKENFLKHQLLKLLYF